MRIPTQSSALFGKFSSYADEGFLVNTLFLSFLTQSGKTYRLLLQDFPVLENDCKRKCVSGETLFPDLISSPII